jgi:hypothetical protein
MGLGLLTKQVDRAARVRASLTSVRMAILAEAVRRKTGIVCGHLQTRPRGAEIAGTDQSLKTINSGFGY